MWSKDYPECQSCKTTESSYMARGLCRRCYLKEYRNNPANSDRIKSQKHDWYANNVQGTDKLRIAREVKHFDGKREVILKRDGFCCTKCGANKSLVVHHLDGNGRGKEKPNNHESNLVTLCRSCHIKEHRQEIFEIKAKNGFKRRSSGRWSLKHDSCRRCQKTEIKHSAHGYCRSCIYHLNRGSVKI